MKITDALMGEHGLFRNLLQSVERLRAESHDLIELRTAAAVLDNALATHSDIEETIFFPALESHIGDAGPLAVMRAEHEELDRYVSEMRDSEDVAITSRRCCAIWSLWRGPISRRKRPFSFPSPRRRWAKRN